MEKNKSQLETFLSTMIPMNVKHSIMKDGKCPVCGLELLPEEENETYHRVRHQHATEMIKRYGIYLKYEERELLKKLAWGLRYSKHLEMRILGVELVFFAWYMRAAQNFPYESMRKFPDFEDYIAMLLDSICPGEKYPLDWAYTYGEDGRQKPDTELVEALIARYGQKEGLEYATTDFLP